MILKSTKIKTIKKINLKFHGRNKNVEKLTFLQMAHYFLLLLFGQDFNQEYQYPQKLVLELFWLHDLFQPLHQKL